MTPRQTLGLIIGLALISLAGLIGMLVAGDSWDWAYLLLALLPLAVGGLLLVRSEMNR